MTSARGQSYFNAYAPFPLPSREGVLETLSPGGRGQGEGVVGNQKPDPKLTPMRFRRNDGITLPRIGQNYWQRVYGANCSDSVIARSKTIPRLARPPGI